jgi:hypothetical protein
MSRVNTSCVHVVCASEVEVTEDAQCHHQQHDVTESWAIRIATCVMVQDQRPVATWCAAMQSRPHMCSRCCSRAARAGHGLAGPSLWPHYMIAMGHGSVWCDHNQFKAGIFVEYKREEIASCIHGPRGARRGQRKQGASCFGFPFVGVK